MSAKADHCVPPESLASVKRLLSEWPLQRYLSRKPPSAVISVTDEMTIERVLKLFASTQISSAPIFSATNDTFLGFLDVNDVLKTVLTWFNIREFSLNDCDRRERLRRAGVKIRSCCVRDVCFGADGQLLYKAHAHSNLYQVISEGFLQPADGGDICHRIGVFDFESDYASRELPSVRVTNIVTQTDMIRFLYQHCGEFPELSSQSVVSLGLAQKSVVCVPSDMSTLHVFSTMYANKVSSVGIVDRGGHGALAGTLSVSDIRGLQPGSLEMLALPVNEFIDASPACSAWGGPSNTHWLAESYGVKPAPASPQLPTCVLSTCLRELLGLMVDHGWHSVYVIDEEGRPVGIVSMTDVLSLVTGVYPTMQK